MKTFSLPLIRMYSRPVLEINGYMALIDTGAEIPVCFLPRNVIGTVFRGELLLKDQKIGTLGESVNADIFVFNQLTLGEMIFPGLKIAVPEKKKPEFDFLLSAPMFANMSVEMDFKTYYATFSIGDQDSWVRNVIVKDRYGKEHVLCGDIPEISGPQQGQDF